MSSEMTELELLEYYEQAWLNRDLKSNHSLAGHTHNLRVNAEYAAESKGYIARGYAGNAPAPSRITDKGILRLEQLRHEQTKAQLANWEALGRELIELFSIGYSQSIAVGENLVLINRDMYGLYDKNSLEYQVLSRLLELTSE